MAAVHPRAAFPGHAPNHPESSSSAVPIVEPDFFAAFNSTLPQLDFLSRPFPESSLTAPPANAAAMDYRALHFDPATLDQLMANTPSFLPDLEVPADVFGNAFANNNSAEAGHYSAGSSPRDDQSHTSGEQHDLPLKAASGALIISEEERAMLAESGVVIPVDALTLTKAEEKALKSVRRRLRNKISAQDSRRKKKEYVDGLEQRVASCTAVNIEMQSKVATLANENRTLRQQLLQLKEMVARLGGPHTAATTGTLLMVLALSFSMFVNPLSSSVAANATASEAPLPGPGSRTLKALDQRFTESLPLDGSLLGLPSQHFASLRDSLSSLLFNAQHEDHEHETETESESEQTDGDADQRPPSLAPPRSLNSRPTQAGPAVRANAP